MTETRDTTATPERGGSPGRDRLGPLGRIALFFRQVVAEMRKVVRPTRNQLVTYTVVVVIFVAAFMAIVVGLDSAFVRLVDLVFG
jgi:preprotein translocase subunit SecE